MSRIRTPPRLSAWRDRVDDTARLTYTRLPPFWRTRARRVAYAFVPIIQCGLAAALAWFIATDLLHHERAFFAPVAATISLGTGTGKRLSRGLELTVGAVVGIALGDLFIAGAGSGPWQIALVVIVAMLLAVALDGSAILSSQAAVSAVLVATLLPPGSGPTFDRIIDAAVGGTMALLVMSILPTHPLKRVRREAASLLGVTSSVLREVAEGLERADAELISDALEQARNTQSAIENLDEQLQGSAEVMRISPFFRTRRHELEELQRIVRPLDHGIRNTRVLARRSVTAVEDHVDIHPKLVNLIDHLADGLEELSRFVAKEPGAVDAVTIGRQLRMIAAGLRRELASGGTISETVVLAQMRSILVDMLQVAGLSRISAIATLPVTVSNPAVTPAPSPDVEDDAPSTDK